MHSDYRGRFAPTPSGPLHLGSLVTAVASWLDARVHKGIWLVRIEDVDTPRCPEGVSDIILQQLERYGLYWDEEISYQHQHDGRYQNALDQLIEQHHAYPCGCSRKEWQSYPHYPGWCREGNRHPERHSAWRLNTESTRYTKRQLSSNLTLSPEEGLIAHWQDNRLGSQKWNLEALGDVVLKRKDDLWAYQLAVVTDDAAQGINHVVRGTDLLDNTPWQILLQSALDLPTPAYTHLPLICTEEGQKLSKQNLAPSLPDSENAIRHTLFLSLQLLGLNPDKALMQYSVEEQLGWAIPHWRSEVLPQGNICVKTSL